MGGETMQRLWAGLLLCILPSMSMGAEGDKPPPPYVPVKIRVAMQYCDEITYSKKGPPRYKATIECFKKEIKYYSALLAPSEEFNSGNIEKEVEAIIRHKRRLYETLYKKNKKCPCSPIEADFFIHAAVVSELMSILSTVVDRLNHHEIDETTPDP
ncbi:MAG: hypothetical protein HQL51_14535 [Magnetococcales bacterium]|nr:hypothetical protein [Magnetococcales bacterium]